ncbi:aconitate hydratase AcnA [Streptomyces sp. NPDC059134]|uniref:aconitate hydratase AcnA n=1 Tax=Streptomyces sp. NPDC059134 TaxID=3346738 RepID=UPI0036BF113C
MGSVPVHFATIDIDGSQYRFMPLEQFGLPDSVPYTLRALLENVASRYGEVDQDVLAAVRGATGTVDAPVVAFSPSRILLQDYTGVACLVDLVSLRDTVQRVAAGGPPIEPTVPVQLVVDHSISVDHYRSAAALGINTDLDYRRNEERYRFFKWCEAQFERVTVVPPGHGIVHQVNLEHLAEVVGEVDGVLCLDSCVGTDSHTTMINALGVLGWGVGGIEAIGAALRQPLDLVLPPVVGVELRGELQPGITATDVVLTITERLRRHGVVGKFVEFCGDGLAALSLPTRATLSNMSPEFGSTCAIFPIDEHTIDYLRLTGRPQHRLRLVEGYARAQGLWADALTHATYDESLVIDLGNVTASVAGPSRPDQRSDLREMKTTFRRAIPKPRSQAFTTPEGGEDVLSDGAVVLAAITSCTNTSNPAVMIAAGLLAKNAVERGLSVKPWIKTSLAPGSTVVTTYLERAGLTPYLDRLGFNLVGYGCTTCSGNSGPLPTEINHTITESGLTVAAVLSGNRNFEGRINPDARLGYLVSPPLVIAFAIAGTVDIDIDIEPIGTGCDGSAVYLREIWPSDEDVQKHIGSSVDHEMYLAGYRDIFSGDSRWQKLSAPPGGPFTWDNTSTYLRQPPYLDKFSIAPERIEEITDARILLWLGDDVTTDHISPAGAIIKDGPAGQYLAAHGVKPSDFNTYGARRGNHEVMTRGTFSNHRLRNRLTPEIEGGVTRIQPTGEIVDVHAAAAHYRDSLTPMVVIAGKRYGTGSSRDWAAKGTALLGVRAVIAESFERIHRSNLIGMGVLPLQFPLGESAESLGIKQTDIIDVSGIVGFDPAQPPSTVIVRTSSVEFRATVRLDTPREATYYAHQGLIPFLARQLLATTRHQRVEIPK